MNKTKVEQVILQSSFNYVSFNVFLLFTSLAQFKIFPIMIPLAWQIFMEAINWYCFQKNLFIKSIDSFIYIIIYMYIATIYYLEVNYYAYVSVMMAISFFLRVKQSCQNIDQQEYSAIFAFLKTFYRLFILISTVCVTLKLNELVQWTWAQTFWWYWMYLSGLIGMSFTLFMVILSKLFNDLFNRGPKTSVLECIKLIIQKTKTDKVLIWGFAIGVVSSLQSGIWILNTFNQLGSDIPFSLGIFYFCVLSAFNILMYCITTILIHAYLVDFFLTINLDIEQTQQLPDQAQTQHKRETLKIHKFLIRMSSAYFRSASQLELRTRKFTMIATNEIFTERGNKMSTSQMLPTGNDQQAPPKKNVSEVQQKQQSMSNRSCIVCFDGTPNAVFMKCGHGGICYKCAMDIFVKTKECYLCREHIDEVLEIESTNESLIKVISTTKNM
ncbi:hypothetical protein pb186bvf_002734 [Paramecium bursaria]